ncbi:anhydro-N-acetylmuramic acid kinase [Clostridium sp. D2Q-11]|uniref:Anhydro-N-acetylmuramic acid kinase n=1 Tax=Anaeromonas frigoriresistens TaxID=2683708 RepID=A0A942UT27_9FIRM|nr:anhydro-N-acetylmuramic acid kinase AnmK [Anaeromonas frigoriresistens]MBS4536890.1 anhydro-N-acetylmuramic acid kinase [Anaeromonas frigoriresistens]
MKYAIGLMSGTSLDGIDSSLVEIEGNGINTKFKEKFFNCYSIPKDIKREIHDSMDLEKSNVALICSLNYKLGKLFADACIELCYRADIPIENIDFIASHGQTIYHNPYNVKNYVPSTLQIGEPSIIAYNTKTTVISNFRGRDIAAGGQGAPLVPYLDYILFSKYKKNIAIHNIGGIANTTIVPSTGKKDDILAFDTGPGNMIIDGLCMELKGLEYDKDGQVAKSGKINYKILEKMMNHSFLKKLPPKSTGREDFGMNYVRKLIGENPDVTSEDLIATATEFTALTMAEAYKSFVLDKLKLDELILCGGGAYNSTLLKSLQGHLKEVKVSTMEDHGMNSFSKEALAFAILGNECLNNIESNVKSATGAKDYVVLGDITYS